jgi:hypothetical protein
MSQGSHGGERLRSRLTARSEDALGKLAQDLLENPLINGALTRALGARESAAKAQEVAMGALNIPSAADIERLTRRVRSVSQRLESIEDALDRIEQSATLQAGGAISQQLASIESQLESLSKKIADLHAASPQAAAPISRDQERLRVEEPLGTAPAPTPRARSGARRPRASGPDGGA